MADPAPLNAHDHLLAAALTALAAERIHDDGREDRRLAALKRALVGANWTHPHVAPLIVPARALLARPDGADRVRALLDASRAVARWHDWRIDRAASVIGAKPEETR